MDYALITLTALFVSGLTLFSGFGLGTLLMPAFAVFFPVPVAIAATAVVHLANNLFKLGLVGRQADWRVVARFSVPAAVAALLGASALIGFAGLETLASYEVSGRTFEVTPVKLVIGSLIAGFATLELWPAFAALAVAPKYLPLGGLLSGFFGGLSGNQGAFRSAFLIKSGLGKEAFIATGVVSAVIVDCVRLTVYGASYFKASFQSVPQEIAGLVISASLAAFLGAFLGSRLLQKITLRAVQIIVALCMIGVGVGLAAGLI
ncbi:MAG: TSUP family transporter [bacterium]|nr:TSUP family transporter [bacterium]